MTCRVNAVYAIFESRKFWHNAIKMELQKAGPHFISLSGDAHIFSSDATKLDTPECRMGDRLFVREIKPTKTATAVLMDDGLASWPPKPTACVVKAQLISRLRIEERIAIALEIGGSALIPRLHYRCCDPFTLSEQALPRSCNDQKPKNHALVKVTYAQHESGTWVDTSGQWMIPHNYGGKPEDFTKQVAPLYVPMKWETLSDDVNTTISEFLKHPGAEELEPFIVDDLLLAGVAAMQSLTRSRVCLASDTVIARVQDAEDDPIDFVAEYAPAKSRCNAATDLAKAARVLKEGQ